jgi:hypothetical protein
METRMNRRDFARRAVLGSGVLFATSATGALTATAPAPPDEKVQIIALDSVHATSHQKPLKPVSRGFNLQGNGEKKYVESYGHFLEEIYKGYHTGASNVFLVRGDHIAPAISATWEVCVCRRGAERPSAPYEKEKGEHKPLWLVAYLGTAGSEPPHWEVRSVERKGRTVRLAFAPSETGSETNDEHQYFYWAPLGELESGAYTLELYDEQEKAVVLTRRVIIGDK